MKNEQLRTGFNTVRAKYHEFAIEAGAPHNLGNGMSIILAGTETEDFTKSAQPFQINVHFTSETPASGRYEYHNWEFYISEDALGIIVNLQYHKVINKGLIVMQGGQLPIGGAKKVDEGLEALIDKYEDKSGIAKEFLGDKTLREYISDAMEDTLSRGEYIPEYIRASWKELDKKLRQELGNLRRSKSMKEYWRKKKQIIS
jgi:hypothetical protein